MDGQTIFGKTGTTDNTTDAWFIGANAPGAGMQLATAVWFGNYTGNVGGAGFGGDSAAPVFQSFMSQALQGQGAGAMPDPGPVCARPGGSVNQDGGRNTAPRSRPARSRRSSRRCSSRRRRPRRLLHPLRRRRVAPQTNPNGNGNGNENGQ